MPASTPEQQRLMGMAYSLKKGEMDPKDASQQVKDLADGMTLKQLKDFASTKHSEMKEDFALTYEKFINEDYARVHPNPGMNVGGMGPIVIPGSGPFGVKGSGDIPAPYSSKDKKLMKSGKKKGVMPIKFAETDFQSFENLIQFEEGRQIMEELSAALNFAKEYQILEKSETYTRILERVMPLNEDTETYYSLSETRKNQIDEIVWNGIYEYAISDEINEGFFSSIVNSVRDAGKSAIELAWKVIENTGAFLKAAKEYIKAGLIAAMKAGTDASKDLFGKAKSKADDLKKKVDLTSDMLKKDLKDLKDTVNHIVKSLPGQYDAINAQQVLSILKTRPDKDMASAQGSLQRELNKHSKPGNYKQLQASESIYNLLDISIKHAILELKNSSGYLESIMEDAESVGQDIASDAEAKKKESGKNKVEKAKGKGISFMGVVHLLMTGIVTFVEACLKAMYRMGFKSLSVVISKLGGPGPFEFIAISSLLAAVTGLVLELFAEVIGELTGSKYIKLVSDALHSTNPAMLAGHAVEHSLPGASSIIKVCCISYAIYETVEHVISLGEHKEEPAKD